jgi:hypothetical protein
VAHVTVERSARLMNQQSSARPARYLTPFSIPLMGERDAAARLEYSSSIADQQVLSNYAMRLCPNRKVEEGLCLLIRGEPS